MHSVKLLVSRGSATSPSLTTLGLFGHSHQGYSAVFGLSQHQSSLHTSEYRAKFQTDTDLVHQGVQYGRSAYPSRPNDPRVPSNAEFGITYLHKTRLANEPTTTSEVTTASEKRSVKKDSISKAMKIYLERAKKHHDFMDSQEADFELGRRHLANMMGINEATMSQADINLAVQYLMPSGLFDHRARPRMRPPKEIYPAIKEAQFKPNGRPFHPLFYTGKANFYDSCFDIEEEVARLKEYEDSQLKLGITNPPEDARIQFRASAWLTPLEMKQFFLEKIDTKRYVSFIGALERLAEHPYSKLSAAFLNKFRKQIKSAAELMEIVPLKADEAGRPYMNATGFRKYCVAHVTVRGNGTGLVDINGKDILYFDNIQDREQVMTPLKFTGLLHKVDIECRTMHEEYTKEWSADAPPFPNGERWLGISAQSGAIRHAISLALKSFVDRDTVEKMRLVGLLTKDQRTRERKKWGQEGARRKFTWKKR